MSTCSFWNLFNSHPHKEDDHRQRGGLYVQAFSIHILTRRMTNCITFTCKTIYFFNSHPHKEDDCGLMMNVFILVLFNSHPHKEDDYAFERSYGKICFSTHILTRRMTVQLVRFARLNMPFSTHILTRRMTFFLSPHIKWEDLFNSHPHKEDDLAGYENEMRSLIFQLTSSQGG